MAQFKCSGNRARGFGGGGSAGERTADDQDVGAVIAGGAWGGDTLLVLHLGIGGTDTWNDGEEVSRRRCFHRSYVLGTAHDAGKARLPRELRQRCGMVAPVSVRG